MRPTWYALVFAASAAIGHAATLTDVCTTAYVQASLPADDVYQGITIDPTSVTASPVTNASSTGANFYPDATFDYCSVGFSYSHNGRNDNVNVAYWLPTPDKFQKRYLSTGGGGYAITSGVTSRSSLPGGIIYGASAGTTDGGFGSFNTQFDAVFLLANGTIDWQAVHMFGYEAHHELTTIGKVFTKNFFGMAEDEKLYAYYQGCSEGGREGWSQVQRFADEWDGAITGAPAMRFSFQQVQHLYSNVVEQTLGYYPPPCELQKIVNETIAACDPLDGKVDGVVARTDLCQLNFNINSTIGEPYYCAATAARPGFKSKRQMSSPATPEQNGTVTAEGVAVASEILKGLHDSEGRRVYLTYQPAASFADAATQYNAETGEWELSISGLGAEFPARFLQLQNTSTLATLDNVTYDTLKDWMLEGWQKYEDTLQTTWPDLTPFQAAGGKVLHFHGESDDSIPTASSVRYYESVRQVMYPGLSYNASVAALDPWYRLFLVPGAGHCAPSTAQPNGPFPQSNLATLIDWVERDIEPVTLNATVLAGPRKGEKGQICSWPLRPMWSLNGTLMQCEYDQASIDTWIYDFDAVKLPVY
ncbi:tannase subunit protein [Phlyctema vagabunda]|uniref:Carboxylic ester hydrolase n=1 Tax=Phlyctema vagabunda TaxID=108571 RepID=A0ABR4PWS0_9HELO